MVQQLKYYSYADYQIPISIPKLYSPVYMTSWLEWLINISNTTSHIKTEFLTLSPKPALPKTSQVLPVVCVLTILFSLYPLAKYHPLSCLPNILSKLFKTQWPEWSSYNFSRSYHLFPKTFQTASYFTHYRYMFPSSSLHFLLWHHFLIPHHHFLL